MPIYVMCKRCKMDKTVCDPVLRLCPACNGKGFVEKESGPPLEAFVYRAKVITWLLEHPELWSDYFNRDRPSQTKIEGSLRKILILEKTVPDELQSWELNGLIATARQRLVEQRNKALGELRGDYEKKEGLRRTM